MRIRYLTNYLIGKVLIVMDMNKVGAQIACLRREKGLTQSELGDRLGVSFQAVSKWERGETLPDTAILLDLANALGTSVDLILTGGSRILHYKGRFNVAQMQDGLLSLKHMGELLGRDNPIYRHAINGINENLNTNIEDAFMDHRILECFVAETCIFCLSSGMYVDPTDVRNSFQHERFRDIVLEHCQRYGII